MIHGAGCQVLNAAPVCGHDGHLRCSTARHLLATLSPFYRPLPTCGLQTGPTPYIAMANECTWAPALSAPKGLLVLCTSVCLHLPAVQLGQRNRWKSAGGLLQEPALLHHVALSADSVVLLCHCGRWYVAAVEWSPGIAISAIATRHAAAPAASS